MGRPKIPLPCLCAVTDGSDGAEAVAAAVRGGAGMIQLRRKDAPAGELLGLARELRAATKGKALLTVNDRADIAALSDADGVHLGENSLGVADARRLLGDEALIGRSVHDVDGAVRAQAAGADYLILGTIFPTRSHPGAAGAGLSLVEETARAVSIPIFGIGGIGEGNAAGVIRAGASGAAAISAVFAAANPRDAAERLSRLMRSAADSETRRRKPNETAAQDGERR